MGWIILICFIVLVLAFLFSTGIDFDWTDFFPFQSLYHESVHYKMRSEERKMFDLLDVLLSIILELLPAIGEVLPDIPGTSAAPTQQTDKPNT